MIFIYDRLELSMIWLTRKEWHMKLKLRAKRVERGFTQEGLAKAIGVSTATYNRYEIGRTEMTESTINKVLLVLDCKYEDIFVY